MAIPYLCHGDPDETSRPRSHSTPSLRARRATSPLLQQPLAKDTASPCPPDGGSSVHRQLSLPQPGLNLYILHTFAHLFIFSILHIRIYCLPCVPHTHHTYPRASSQHHLQLSSFATHKSDILVTPAGPSMAPPLQEQGIRRLDGIAEE